MFWRSQMQPTEDKIVARKFVRVRERNQITLPSEIILGTKIAAGDFLEVILTEDGAIRLSPTLIASVNSAEAYRQEALAEKEIARGDYTTFDSATEMMSDLTRRQAKRQVKSPVGGERFASLAGRYVPTRKYKAMSVETAPAVGATRPRRKVPANSLKRS